MVDIILVKCLFFQVEIQQSNSVNMFKLEVPFSPLWSLLCEIGFCIYGPVALIGIQALNLVPKNAAGTAAGFVGLFGYLFGDAVLAKIVMGSVANDNSLGWNATFWMFIVASLLATAFCATTWKREKQALSR